MAANAEAKRAWQRENRKGRGSSNMSFTYSEIMKARGYDLKSKEETDG